MGSGSERELELGTRPSSHLLVAHQVDLDVREREAPFLTDARHHGPDGEARSGQDQGGGAVRQVHAAILPRPAFTLTFRAPKALPMALIQGRSGEEACAHIQGHADRYTDW